MNKRPLYAKDENSVPKLVADTCQSDAPKGKKPKPDDAEKNERLSRLTQREYDVLLLLLEGYTLKETAGKLKIAYSTANTHQTAIYRKLEVNSKTELIITFR